MSKQQTNFYCHCQWKTQTETKRMLAFFDALCYFVEHGVGEDGREWLDQGEVGRISILLLVYPRQRGSYRATTMSPVMSTVRHCPLLPGESIFAWSRAESGNYVAASLNDAIAIGLLFQDLTSSAHSCDSYPVIPSLRRFTMRRRISRNLDYLHLSQIENNCEVSLRIIALSQR